MNIYLIVCIFTFFLVYTCKHNSDCHGNGYCKREFHLEVKRVVGVCKCEPNYMYALDCSIFGCKYHLQHHCRFLVPGNMKKFLCRFDTSFDIKMIVQKIAIQIIFKSHEPLQSYQLTGVAKTVFLAELAGTVSWHFEGARGIWK